MTVSQPRKNNWTDLMDVSHRYGSLFYILIQINIVNITVTSINSLLKGLSSFINYLYLNENCKSDLSGRLFQKPDPIVIVIPKTGNLLHYKKMLYVYSCNELLMKVIGYLSV